MTYAQLLEHLEKELKVGKSRMKLRHGFPPKELGPPAEGEGVMAVPLQHGDRLAVEIAADPEQGGTRLCRVDCSGIYLCWSVILC